MKTDEINIRDPYVLLHEGKYYLYGTRSATTWGKADGFDCYISSDLNDWDGPVEIFHNYGDFWADRNYWAPECYYFNGVFYLVTTFGAEKRKKGVQILKSETPIGPFIEHSEGPVTADDWDCIDGTLYFNKNNEPYLIFNRTFEDKPDGEMLAMRLSWDIKKATGEPWLLFDAKSSHWAVPAPFAKDIPGISGDIYLADGPCTYRTSEGELLIIWSSWGVKGYTVGIARSDNGEIDGKWSHLEQLLFSENGGHGMMFKNKENEWMYTLHFPNDFYKERPQFKRVRENDGKLQLEGNS